MSANIDTFIDLSQKIAAAGQVLFKLSMETPVSCYPNTSINLVCTPSRETCIQIQGDLVIRPSFQDGMTAHQKMETAHVFQNIDSLCPALIEQVKGIPLLTQDPRNTFDIATFQAPGTTSSEDWYGLFRMNRRAIAEFTPGKERALRAALEHLLSIPNEFLEPQPGYPNLRSFSANSEDFYTKSPTPEAAYWLFKLRGEPIENFREEIDTSHLSARIQSCAGHAA